MAEDEARVARAAAEIGVEVPDKFFLTGIDDGGSHTAFMAGTARDFKHSAAILHRLNGGSIAEVRSRMTQEPEEDVELPVWWPPDDPNDADAWQSYMTERKRHPEWPHIYNSASDIFLAVCSSAGVAMLVRTVASSMDLRQKIKFAKWLIVRAQEQGLNPDPVAVLRAFEGAAPTPSEANAAELGDDAPQTGPPNNGGQDGESGSISGR